MANRSPKTRKPASKSPRARRAPSRKRSPKRRTPPKSPRQAAPKKQRPAAVGRARSAPRPGRLRRLLVLLLLSATVALAIDVALLWESVTDRMEGRVHDEPARITGFVPRLATGSRATAEGWRQTWLSQGYREVAGAEAKTPGQFSMAGARWHIVPKDGPQLEVRVHNGRIQSLRRVGDAQILPAWDFPPSVISLLTDERRERRTIVPYSAIPPILVHAVLAIEDTRFFRHPGIDPQGIARAIWVNLRGSRLSQGGSTLTQQLAKNMFLSAERSFGRKVQEAMLAGILEYRYDKERILEAYLNEIYLGQREGYAIMGVAEGAQHWFGKEVSALAPEEAALLAGAIHAPNRTVPWRHPDEAKDRRDRVLRRMQEQGYLSADDAKTARLRPVRFASAPKARRQAPWFVEAVVSDLGNRYTPEALHRDGLEVVTTLDPRLQKAAEEAVRTGLKRLMSGPLAGQRTPPQAALLALDPESGAIRALVGGRDFGESQFNRALQARRQPGSAFKPIVLAAVLSDQWPQLGPESPVDDDPLTLAEGGPNGGPWSPRNYDGTYEGTITLRRATEASRNLPFVRLGLLAGTDRVRQMAATLGIESPLSGVPSLSIGSQELTLLDLGRAYATLAAGGLRPDPHLIEGVRTADGQWLERRLPHREAVLDPAVAATITDLLEGVVDRGTARGVRSGGLTLPVAAKTGTSNGARDAWVAGYTPDLVVVLWVGHDQDKSLGLPSSQAAVPIWADFFHRIQPLLAGHSFPKVKGPATRGHGRQQPAAKAEARQRRRDLEAEDRGRRRAEREAEQAVQ